MEENTEISILDLLPKDIIEKVISPMLSLKDLSRLARTSKGINSKIKEPFADAKLTRLLEHVAFGNQDQAEMILKTNPDLLLEPGNVTDYSLRTFKGITAFQYALWALDRHMWTMILKYLPDEKAARQLHDHVYNEKKYKEMHRAYYDFVPLINALQTYVDNYLRRTDDENIKHWCEVVGGTQRLVPVHVVNEYCRADRSFDPLPQFREDNLPRRLNFYNYVKGTDSVWFPLTSNGLGGDFAIIRGPGAAVGLRRGWRGYGSGGRGVALDLSAMTTLCRVRTAELVKLKQQLLNPAPTPEKSSCVIS